MKPEFVGLLKHAQQCLVSGELERGALLCEQALEIEPAAGAAQNILGMIFSQQRQHQQAIHQFELAIECEPSSPLARNNLGAVHLDLGDLDAAMSCFERVIALHPGYAVAHKNLGLVHQQKGDMKAAIACFRDALFRNQNYAPAHCAWGDSLYSLGDFSAAATQYKKFLEIQDDLGVRVNLANTLSAMGHHEQAVEMFLTVAKISPDLPGLQNNLGLSLVKLGRIDEAIASYKKAISFEPDSFVPYNSLGNAFTQLGLPGEAVQWFRAALAIKPDFAKAHSNLLLNLNYIEYQQEIIYQESLRFDERHTQSLTASRVTYSNSKSVARKLRIGYLSGDFRNHSVAYFALPLLEAHDREKFDIYCYSNNLRDDDVTARFRSLADQWLSIRCMTDDAVAEQIRCNKIDILVDLAGHTGDNRLLVFARGPAPIQVSWLGYPNTSGLEAMNYRVTDAVADPSGAMDSLYSEQLIRLPSGFLCYRNDTRSALVSSPPEARTGFVTFGSFNTLGKVTTEVVDTWAEILREVPGSRLILKSLSLQNEPTRESFLKQFGEREIAPERLDLLGLLPKHDHFRLYSEIDIALDTFPYNGTTTSCEAMWMGVPIVTLEGNRHAGRVGASILHQLGLTDLIADDRASYISLARSLAGDIEKRSRLRKVLREQMRNSDLMNQSLFAKEMEDAYRSVWKKWCADGC